MTPGLSRARRDEHAGDTPVRIALVGLRGSGKSTVGALLARELACAFVDLDQEIEHAWVAGPSASASTAPLRAGEILAVAGEPAFRELEARALAQVLARPGPLVLATGGGVVLREENRRALRAGTWVVWLQAPTDELVKRLRADPTPRPSLTGADPLAELELLGAARAGMYDAIAHARIRTEGLTPAEVARLLGAGLPSLGLEDPPAARP